MFAGAKLDLKQSIFFFSKWSYALLKIVTARVVYLTIIPRTRVGYELLDSGRGTGY